MQYMLGEPGTEQFTVTTKLEGRIIGEQKIHDPFVNTRIVICWRDLLKALLRFTSLEVSVHVHGSRGGVSSVMMLDPFELQRQTEELETGRSEPMAYGEVGR